MAPCEKGEGDSKQRDRGAAITRRFSGQLEGVAQKGVLPEREGRTHRTPAVRCILDAERRDARIRRILFVVPLLLFKGENIKTMHRQQRLRSPSSSPSSQSLPRFSTSRSSVSSVLLAPAATSTATSAATPTPTPTPASALTATSTPAPIPIIPTPTPTKPIASATGPTSPIVLPASSTWSTSKLSPYVWNVQQTSCSSLALLSNESSIAQSTPSTISLPVPCPRLVSVLAWSMTLLLVTSCIGLTDAGILNGHPLGKRSFIDIQCKGIYDKSIFARLDRICEDCYNLFREPQLHQLCRKNCFTSDYFKGCLDVLLLQDEVEKIQTWIKQLHGAEPGV